MSKSVYREAYATWQPIISFTNSQESKRHLQQSKVIEHYSGAISNRVGDIFNSVLFGPCRWRAGWVLRLAPKSKAKLKSILSVLYNHAIRHEWLTFNPISRVRVSQKRLREKDVLTPEEFQSLVEHLSVRDRAIAMLVGSTGLRRSEWIALTWSDLDIRTMEVRVLRSCVRNRFGKTKTEASCRPVPLHPIVLNALLNWRAQSLYATDADFLFLSLRHKGLKPLSPDHLLKKSIRPALVRAGIIGKNIGLA